MSIELATSPIDTVAELVERLGGIPLERIRLRPSPGTACEADVLRVEADENRLCELVDGVLVEKPMGYRESLLAVLLATLLNQFVRPRNLGLVTGADGMIRLFPGLVRIPDVAFASWDRLPGGKVPEQAIPDLAPDLAIEILSRSNTRQEMERKLTEYFAAGVRLVWIVDPEERSATVYTSPDESSKLSERDTLSGAEVLPEFTLLLADLFADLDRQPSP